MAAKKRKPRLGVWKFASCDGCQLILLDCEDELLAVAGAVEIAYFPEATRGAIKGPYDVSLVEGSITTPHDAERIHEVRQQLPHAGDHRRLRDSRRNPGAAQLRRRAGITSAVVYARPEYIHTLATSTPIADHVAVDFELHGCPINKHQLLEMISAFLVGRRPVRRRTASASSASCKRQRLRDGGARHPLPRPGHPCRLRRDLPVLRSRLLRLFRTDGDTEHSLAQPLSSPRSASTSVTLQRVYRTFNADAEPFRKESERHGR